MNVFLDKSGLEHLCKLFMEKYCDKKQADELYLRKDGKAKKAETADKVAHAITVNGKAYDGSKAVTVEVNGGSPFENNALKFPNGGLLEIVKAGESGGQEDPSHGGETGGETGGTAIWSKTFDEFDKGERLPYAGIYRVTSPEGVITDYTFHSGREIYAFSRPPIILAIDRDYRVDAVGGTKTICTIKVSKEEAEVEGVEAALNRKLKQWKIECIKKDE